MILKLGAQAETTSKQDMPDPSNQILTMLGLSHKTQGLGL